MLTSRMRHYSPQQGLPGDSWYFLIIHKRCLCQRTTGQYVHFNVWSFITQIRLIFGDDPTISACSVHTVSHMLPLHCLSVVCNVDTLTTKKNLLLCHNLPDKILDYTEKIPSNAFSAGVCQVFSVIGTSILGVSLDIVRNLLAFGGIAFVPPVEFQSGISAKVYWSCSGRSWCTLLSDYKVVVSLYLLTFHMFNLYFHVFWFSFYSQKSGDSSYCALTGNQRYQLVASARS